MSEGSGALPGRDQSIGPRSAVPVSSCQALTAAVISSEAHRRMAPATGPSCADVLDRTPVAVEALQQATDPPGLRAITGDRGPILARPRTSLINLLSASAQGERSQGRARQQVGAGCSRRLRLWGRTPRERPALRARLRRRSRPGTSVGAPLTRLASAAPPPARRSRPCAGTSGEPPGQNGWRLSSRRAMQPAMRSSLPAPCRAG